MCLCVSVQYADTTRTEQLPKWGKKVWVPFVRMPLCVSSKEDRLTSDKGSAFCWGAAFYPVLHVTNWSTGRSRTLLKVTDQFGGSASNLDFSTPPVRDNTANSVNSQTNSGTNHCM